MNLIFFIWRTLLGLLPGWVTAVPAQAAAEAQPEIDRSVVRLRWRHAEVCCGWMQVAPVYVFGRGLLRASAAILRFVPAPTENHSGMRGRCTGALSVMADGGRGQLSFPDGDRRTAYFLPVV